MKRTLGLILLLVIVSGTCYTLFEMSVRAEPLSDPWAHIPPGATLVMEFPEPSKAWSELANRSQVWRTMRAQPRIDALHKLVSRAFDAAVNDAVMTSFSNRPLLVSFEFIGSEELGALIILSAENPIRQEQLLDLLGCLDPSIIEAADKIAENDYTLQLDSTLGQLHVRKERDLLLISTHSKLLDPFQNDSNTFRWSVTQIRKTLGAGADVHVLVDMEKADDFIDLFIHPEQQRQLKLPNGLAALDIQINADRFLASGVLAPESPMDVEVLGEHGGPNRPQEMIPKDASYVYSLHVEEPMKFTDHFLGTGTLAEMQLKEFRDSLSMDLQEFFSSWLNGELLIALDNDNPSVKWVCARASDRYAAINAFDRLTDAFTNRGMTVSRTETEDRISYHLPSSIPLSIFGPAFDKLHPEHIGLIGDVVVMSSTENSLSKILSSLALDRSLGSTDRGVKQFDQLPEKHRLMMWCDLARSKELASHYVDINRAEGDTSILDALGTLSVVIGEQINDLYHVSMSLEHAPISISAESKIRWRVELPATVERKPDILEDHISRGKNVLIQDMDNVIHFFSSTGEKLWEKQLSGPILGKVHQVDRYKNGKLQFLFNTREKIHLMDRNGRRVEGFPISIPNGSEAPIALIDYDDNADHRILLSDKKGQILNYDITGKTVKGWNPITLSGESYHPIQHIRIKTKDYLLVLEENGIVHLLDRRGQPRYNPSLRLTALSQESIIVEGSLEIATSTIWWADTTGRIWKGLFSGEPELISDREWPDARVLFADLDEDGQMDVIRSSADSISILASSIGRTVFRTIGTMKCHPVLFNFGKGRKLLGVAVDSDEGLFLYDQLGSSVNEDGLEGSSAFSISDLNADGVLEVISTNKEGTLVVQDY